MPEPMLPPERMAYYAQTYNLPYQLDFLSVLHSVVPFAGKRVLEVGGSIFPRELVFGELNAKQWVSVDFLDAADPSVMTEAKRKHYESVRTFTNQDPAAEVLAEDYAIIDGDVTKLEIRDHFDVTISIAAFEHVLRFGGMLDKVHAALAPGGHLISLYQPIWPCVNGHHLWGIKDKAGNEYSFATDIIPPWGHMLMLPAQLRQYLLTRTDADCADDIVEFVYHKPGINRLFYEDYVEYLDASPFRFKQVVPLRPIEPAAQYQTLLEALYPGRKRFDVTTILMQGVK